GAELRVDAVDFESNGNSTVNKVGRGGAIYLKEAPAHFRRTTFYGNRAVRGGAIFIYETTPLRGIESTFFGNTSSKPANNSGIDVDGRGDLKIVNSTFFGVGGVDEVIHVESGKADIFFPRSNGRTCRLASAGVLAGYSARCWTGSIVWEREDLKTAV